MTRQLGDLARATGVGDLAEDDAESIAQAVVVDVAVTVSMGVSASPQLLLALLPMGVDDLCGVSSELGGVISSMSLAVQSFAFSTIVSHVFFLLILYRLLTFFCFVSFP